LGPQSSLLSLAYRAFYTPFVSYDVWHDPIFEILQGIGDFYREWDRGGVVFVNDG